MPGEYGSRCFQPAKRIFTTRNGEVNRAREYGNIIKDTYRSHQPFAIDRRLINDCLIQSGNTVFTELLLGAFASIFGRLLECHGWCCVHLYCKQEVTSKK
jgi:hypothetical protein